MSIVKAVLISACLGAALSACGQTGPLYMPQQPAPPTVSEPSMAPDDVDTSASEPSNSSDPDL